MFRRLTEKGVALEDDETDQDVVEQLETQGNSSYDQSCPVVSHCCAVSPCVVSGQLFAEMLYHTDRKKKVCILIKLIKLEP